MKSIATSQRRPCCRADGGAWMRRARIGNSHPLDNLRLLCSPATGPGHPLFDPGGGPRLAAPCAEALRVLACSELRPLRPAIAGLLGDLAIWHGTPEVRALRDEKSRQRQQAARNKLVRCCMHTRSARCCSAKGDAAIFARRSPSGQFAGFFFERGAPRPFFAAGALPGMSSNIDAIGTPRIWQIS